MLDEGTMEGRRAWDERKEAAPDPCSQARRHPPYLIRFLALISLHLLILLSEGLACLQFPYILIQHEQHGGFSLENISPTSRTLWGLGAACLREAAVGVLAQVAEQENAVLPPPVTTSNYN